MNRLHIISSDIFMAFDRADNKTEWNEFKKVFDVYLEVSLNSFEK